MQNRLQAVRLVRDRRRVLMLDELVEAFRFDLDAPLLVLIKHAASLRRRDRLGPHLVRLLICLTHVALYVHVRFRSVPSLLLLR